MKKKYLIQVADEKMLYWYGHYTNKQWTENIYEAKIFDNKQEMEDYIMNNSETFKLFFLIGVEIYTTL